MARRGRTVALGALLMIGAASGCVRPDDFREERRAAMDRLTALCEQGDAEACALVVDLADAERARRAQAARELSVFGDGL